MESQVLEHSGPGPEGAAHAGEKLPVAEVCGSVRVGRVAVLLHQLAVDLIPERPQVQAGLQHALDDGNRLPGRLQLLQAVEELHGLLTHRAIALPTVVCGEEEPYNVVYYYLYFFMFLYYLQSFCMIQTNRCVKR